MRSSSSTTRTRRVQLVVLGDYGRSPRMQYHSLSIAQQAGFEVDVIAFVGSNPHELVLAEPRIHLHLIHPPPNAISRLPRMLELVVKTLYQFVQLMVTLLLWLPKADYLLLQNPPCIPTFTVCQITCALRRTKLVIDWHNFGFSLMALSMGPTHPLVAAAKWYEQYFGKFGHAHMCVTRAMKTELVRWGLREQSIRVVYDCPAPYFHRSALDQSHALFAQLRDQCAAPPGLAHRLADEPPGTYAPCDFLTELCAGLAEDDRATIVTRWTGNEADRNKSTRLELNPHRPAILVSSTSWTPDEDFGMLLEAAQLYDSAVRAAKLEEPPLPNLVIFVTGQGPQRAMYEERMRQNKLQHVAFRTLWLSFENYACLLGSADLGVCLHTSSSGLDLPMKVVDMFGCELPVCAVRYSAIHELVAEGHNGMLFDTAHELLQHMLELFKGFPSKSFTLETLQKGAIEASSRRWDSNWDVHARRIFE